MKNANSGIDTRQLVLVARQVLAKQRSTCMAQKVVYVRHSRYIAVM